MEFHIRVAGLNDVPALTTLFNSDTRIFGEDNTGFGETDVFEYVTDSKKKVLVCEWEGTIIGALMADYHETYSHLETLIVNKQYQKSGAGSSLFDFYENDLKQRNITLIEVLTADDNTIMQQILEKRGFRKGNTFVFYSKGI